jgi:glycosyltransferase involved in cell wall biosynthesis
MRVLLIAFHFPPDAVVGAVRPARVARALLDAGHSVDVVAAQCPGECAGAESDSHHALRVFRVRVPRSPRRLLATLKRWLMTREAPATDTTPSAGWGSPDGVPAWQRWIHSLLWLPDDQQGFIWAAVRSARALIAEGGAYDLVYTSAPPFSTHLAGLVLKRSLGMPWAAEYRDPWVGNPWKPTHVRSWASDKLDAVFERWCLQEANITVAVTPGIQRTLMSRLSPAEHPRVMLALNGIERLREPRPPNTGQTSIVYAGSLYLGRDPRPFLAGLARLLTTSPAWREDLKVRFIGDCRWYRGESVEQFVQQLGLADVVEFTDWIPTEACAELIEQADVLLLLAQRQPLQVANKLFDYLGARRPILAFADAHGETAYMLRALGDHPIVVDDDPVSASDALAKALELSRHTMPDHHDSILHEWTAGVQLSRLVSCIDTGLKVSEYSVPALRQRESYEGHRT